MDPPESNKNLPAAETQEVAKTQTVWPLPYHRGGELTTGYTNSAKLRELHEKLFPEFYKDKNKRQGAHKWAPMEVKNDANSMFKWICLDGGGRPLKEEFPEFEWPEGEWGTQRLLEEMKEAHHSSKDEPAGSGLKAKEESEGKGEEKGKLKDDTESGSLHEPDHIYYAITRSLTQK